MTTMFTACGGRRCVHRHIWASLRECLDGEMKLVPAGASVFSWTPLSSCDFVLCCCCCLAIFMDPLCDILVHYSLLCYHLSRPFQTKEELSASLRTRFED